MLKYYFIRMVHILTLVFRIFPLNSSRILFYSFSGKEYSGSPKYISDYLVEKEENMEIIWAVNNLEKWKFLTEKGWKVIKYNSLAHLYYSATSQFIVTNTGPYKAVRYRKNQKIINTWHGGGAYKKTGIDNPYKGKYEIMYNKFLGQAGVTLFLSSSSAFTKYVIKGAFDYKGEIAECGLPRNDIILSSGKGDSISQKVKTFFHLESSKRMILFAPTWRNYQLNQYEKINIELVLRASMERFGGEWVFIYRGHNLSHELEIEGTDLKCINGTNYTDMQELLIAADILISDYSSCIWDFSLTRKPCFLFTPDLEEYNSKFAFYTPIESWGFDVCLTNKQLADCIRCFSEKKYLENIERNHLLFGICETGKATEYVCNYIKKYREFI